MVRGEERGTPMPRNRTHQDGNRDPRLLEVGGRIKRARLAAGLEQKDLAELIGVTDKSISNWEIGLFSPHRSIGALSAALGVSESWLWEGAPEAPSQDQLVQILEKQTRLLQSVLDELRLLRLDARHDERPM